MKVRPLYEQLHAYVLRKLKAFYSHRINDFPSTGHIPAHILGKFRFICVKCLFVYCLQNIYFRVVSVLDKVGSGLFGKYLIHTAVKPLIN